MMRDSVKKLLCGIGSLLMLTVCAAGIPVFADQEDDSFTEGDLTYVETDGGVSVFKAEQAAEKIVIPKKAGGKPVVGISDAAFSECDALTTLDIQADLTEIGEAAFFYCLQLEKVTLPDTVQTIGAYAFANCYALKEITLPAHLQTLPGYIFYNDIGLSEVTLPRGMERISSMSFVGCYSLRTVHIPETVTEIADLAIVSCLGLSDIDVSIDNPVYRTDNGGALLTANGDTLLLYPSGRTDESYTVPETVKKISQYAFSGAVKLKEIKLPVKIEEIGAGAFADCRSLTTFDFPRQITAIPPSAFADCEALTSIHIPETVTEIGDYAFYCCTGFTEFTIPETVTAIGASAFCGCTSLKEITVPKTVAAIGDYAFGFAPSQNAESSADKPVKQDDFKMTVAPDSVGKDYAKNNGIAYQQKGLSAAMIWGIVIGILVIALGIVMTMLHKRSKDAPVSEKQPAEEPVNDPSYVGILADDDDETADAAKTDEDTQETE